MELKRARKNAWSRFGDKLRRRKKSRLDEIRQERLGKARSTMTMAELSQRREECQGPEFQTRLDFIRFLVDHDKDIQNSSTSSGKKTSSLYNDIFGDSEEDDDGLSEEDTEYTDSSDSEESS